MNSNKNIEEEILIVEDSATQAQMLKFLLEKYNYHVSVAKNGKEALEIINIRKPAIIISDIVMPEMDGFELCRHIKETGNLQDIPVILLTALSDAKDVLKGLECGANNFITKPYEEKYLISNVQSILTNRLSDESEKTQSGIKVSFGGQEYYITAQRQKILNLLLSTYETAVRKNLELAKVKDELMNLTLELESKVEERTIELEVANDKLSQDIARRKVTETELARVNRALRMLSDTNQALIHITEEGTLLNKACQIVVDVGGYRMAWIGFAEHDEAKTLRPVAHAGFESGYIESARVTWADNERGRGPGGMAIRTGQPSISRNILLDPAFAPWREAAIQHGYKSIIALPFISEGQTLGALGIYSSESDAFDTKEVEILRELADDLAFGITALRTRAKRDQAEEALQKSETLLNATQRLTKVGGWEFDVKSGKSFWTEELYRIHEIPNDPGIDHVQESLACYRPEDRQIIYDAFQHACEQGESYDIEFPFTTYTGKPLWIRTTAQPVYEEGRVVRLVGNLMDITERKLAEEGRMSNLRFFECMDEVNRAIQGANDLEQMMREVLDVVISTFNCDRTWLFYPCDPDAPSFRVPMEITKPEYPGAKILNVDLPMPSDMAQNLREAMESTEPVTYTIGTEKTINKVTAEQFGVKSQMMFALYPKLGKPWVFGLHQCSYPRVWTSEEARLFQEIGRRLADGLTGFLSHRDLQENETKYRRIVDTANEGIWMLAEDLMTTFVNARMAELIGYRTEEMIGRPVTDFMFDEDAPDHQKKMENRRLGLSEHYERRYRHKNGQTVWTVASAVPILDAGQNFRGTFAMFTDITQRKQAEEELNKYRDHLEELVKERTASLTAKTDELNRANIKLKELDKLKSMFIASMSHELRTPLNSIIGFSGMTLQGLSGELNEEQRDNLTRVNRSAEHLLSIITDIIDISKIEAGRVDAFYEPFLLNELIAEAVITIQPQAKQKGLALVVDVPTDIKMDTDRKRLLQCILNYMSNAVKFTEVGKVTVQARDVDGNVEISVIDTGIGIAEKNIPQLFEAFERLESHLKIKAGGTGLGLYLTKKMTTELLRGSVGVESIVGKGSTFSLRIPKILRKVGETK